MPTNRKGLSARDAQAPSKITLAGSDVSNNSGSTQSRQRAPAHVRHQKLNALDIGIKTFSAFGNGAGMKLADAFEEWAFQSNYEIFSITPFMGMSPDYEGELRPYYSLVVQYRAA